MSRRKLLATFGVGTAGLTATWALRRFGAMVPKRPAIAGGIQGANAGVGHLLRQGIHSQPSHTRRVGTVIVGAGIAGLSSAWWLQRHGDRDFVVLEMDCDIGGSSSYGRNTISAYPWGAHYVPLPGPDASYVRQFFEEIGVIEGYSGGLPIFNEYHLCADASERLYFQGRWHDGLVPQSGIPTADRKQYDEFFSHVESLKAARGSDGRPAFTIPLDLSSRDPQFTRLDSISMAAFMTERGWTSRYLNWYVNYCCRDDFGMSHDRVSAWAGLHYFAARSGIGANADAQTVLTWPEGNGFLVDQLRQRVSSQVQSNTLAFHIETFKDHATVDVLNTQSRACHRYMARNVIYCAPRFTADRVIKGYRSPVQLDYAPWMVANITVNAPPRSGDGAPLSWDNVSFYSPSLGYIVANHQDLRAHRKEMVLTYYLPLDAGDPVEQRRRARDKSYEEWLSLILPDLEGMHPGISATITHVDIWLWGHGMISPGIDYLWSQKRQSLAKPFGVVQFAHSDMSGISIFEEAQYRGVEAARRVLDRSRA